MKSTSKRRPAAQASVSVCDVESNCRSRATAVLRRADLSGGNAAGAVGGRQLSNSRSRTPCCRWGAFAASPPRAGNSGTAAMAGGRGGGWSPTASDRREASPGPDRTTAPSRLDGSQPTHQRHCISCEADTGLVVALRHRDARHPREPFTGAVPYSCRPRPMLEIVPPSNSRTTSVAGPRRTLSPATGGRRSSAAIQSPSEIDASACTGRP